MKKIIFCIPGRQFSDRFLLSWSTMLINLPRLKVEPFIRGAYESNVYKVRNRVLGGKDGGERKQAPMQGEVPYDYIMWIDSDQVWQVEDFTKLLRTMEDRRDIHILSGVYRKGDGEETTVAVESEEGKAVRFLGMEEIRAMRGPTRVRFAGFGFVIVRRGVFEKVPYPWFRPLGIVGSDGKLDRFTGEDIGFCVVAQDECGFATWVEPSVVVGHEKAAVY